MGDTISMPERLRMPPGLPIGGTDVADWMARVEALLARQADALDRIAANTEPKTVHVAWPGAVVPRDDTPDDGA